MSVEIRLAEITPGRGRKPASFKQKNKIVDTRISVCNMCNRGIFPHHEYLWTSRGLVHKDHE
jgi:hypothetical protein